MLLDMIKNKTNGAVSFKTAFDIATGVIGKLYGSLFSQIKPVEVGSQARAMRIGEDYALRLNSKHGN